MLPSRGLGETRSDALCAVSAPNTILIAVLLALDLPANLAVSKRDSVDLRVGCIVEEGPHGRAQVARVNALYRRPDNAVRPDRPPHRARRIRTGRRPPPGELSRLGL
jgi:hypothetical protein